MRQPFDRYTLTARLEPWLFLAALVVLASEIFSNRWVMTEDGAAHIYNAVMVRETFSGGLAGAHFLVNPSPVPNWLGHALLTAFTFLFPLDVADKLLHLVIVAGLAYSFRLLVRQINPQNRFAPWLIFPFIYTTVYYFGFYNYLLGVALLLLALACWMRAEKTDLSVKSAFPPLLACTLLYFAQLVPFFIFAGIAGVKLLFELRTNGLSRSIRRALFLLSMLLPGVIFFLLYYFNRTEPGGNNSWSDPAATFMNWYTLRPAFTHEYPQWAVAKVLSAVLCIVALVQLVMFIREYRSQERGQRLSFIFWGAVWLLMMALMLIVPDSFGGGGIMTLRLTELAWIMFAVFISAGKLPRLISWAPGITCFIIAVIQLNLRSDLIRRQGEVGGKIQRLALDIKPSSTGAFIPFADHWMLLHCGEIAFAESKTVMLSNYETLHDYFPLKFQKPLPYNYTLGSLSPFSVSCAQCYWPHTPYRRNEPVDYIVLLDQYVSDTACYRRVKEMLDKDYLLRREDLPVRLYESRKHAAEYE